MNKPVEVMVLVEGKTEFIFVRDVLACELRPKMVFLNPKIISKPGDNGGDVKFQRAQQDIRNFLKQRRDTYITTFVDYYGVKEWPGVETIPPNAAPGMIAQIVNEATRKCVKDLFPELWTEKRFIPYMAIHEFEALLFSDSEILASGLKQKKEVIDAILHECGEPEAINNDPHTAPSNRLIQLTNGQFKKTTLGIIIAQAIGIPKMREKCPVFNGWLKQLEALVHA